MWHSATKDLTLDRRELGELFVDDARSGRIRTQLRRGEIRRVRSGLYTTNTEQSLDEIVRRNLWSVIGLAFPDSLVSHRTSLEGRPTPGNTIFLTGFYNRMIEYIPGIRIRVLKGPAPLDSDPSFFQYLRISSEARQLLECLAGQPKGSESAYVSTEAVAARIERIRVVDPSGPERLLRDARRIADEFGWGVTYQRLASILEAGSATLQ